LGLGRRHEELDLHLLELARAENEVPGCDLVPESLADLGDAERRLAPGELEHVLEVDEDALRGLGTQEDAGGVVANRPHEGLEHQVELARLAQLTPALGAAKLPVVARLEVVRPPALLALA